MKWTRNRVVCAVVCMVVLYCMPTAHSKGSGGKVKVGNLECPCFCSTRAGSDFSPYWEDNFGDREGDQDGPDCAGPCVDVTDPNHISNKPEMFCSAYVDYKYCPRIFDDRISLAVQANITWADNHARECASVNPFSDGDCVFRMHKGACLVAFPMCDANDAATPLCNSFCIDELITCRTTDSAFGPFNVIEDLCGSFEPHIVEGDGQSGICSSAMSLRHLPVLAVALVMSVVTVVATLG